MGSENNMVAVQTGQRWQHVKRGTTYEVVGLGELQTTGELFDGASLVIYRGDDGKLWAREEGEFTDGRFVLTATPDRSDDALAEENRRLREALEIVIDSCDQGYLRQIAHTALKGDGLEREVIP